jgi:hypothetical protein
MESDEVFSHSSKKQKTDQQGFYTFLVRFPTVLLDPRTLPSIRDLMDSIEIKRYLGETRFFLKERSLTIVDQPDTYQVSNYNIQPLLVVDVASHLIESPCQVNLVADYRIEDGFQSGCRATKNTRYKNYLGTIDRQLTFISWSQT